MNRRFQFSLKTLLVVFCLIGPLIIAVPLVISDREIVAGLLLAAVPCAVMIIGALQAGGPRRR